MADYGYLDYVKDVETQQLDWASGASPLPFVAERQDSLTNPAPDSLGKVASSKTPREKYDAAYKYAFARDFIHRHRTGSSFLLKAGFTGTALPSAIRVSADNVSETTDA